MAAALTPQAELQKWQTRLAAAGPAYTAGTAAVTASPMAAAAAKGDAMLAGVTAAVTSGRWAAKLNAVPISTWKSQCAIGASKLSAGAQKGAVKMAAAIQKAGPIRTAQTQAAAAAGTDPVAKFSAALTAQMTGWGK